MRARSRSQVPGLFLRSFPLEDIRIRAGGDGRTVEAYAAVFDTPAEVRDQDGHYREEIDRRAFDRTLSHLKPAGGRAAWRVGVFYNHGRTLWGTPSERGSMPIGTPLEIRADARGLLTVTRYNRTELAEEVLENIREGAITGQSFTGSFLRSAPLVPRGGFRPSRDGALTTVRRLESSLKEYGPTPFPVYAEAAVMGVRAHLAADFYGSPFGQPPQGAGTPQDSPDLDTSPDGSPSAEDSPQARHSVRPGERAATRLRISDVRHWRP